MSEEHPAMIAAHESWRCVQSHLEVEWLDLMADDVVIEDPIGVSPLDPEGKGHRGKEAVRAFYRKNIAPATIHIEAHESYAAGMESAHLMTLTTSFSNGMTTTVRGIFSYRVDDAGKLKALRGYWRLADMKVEQSS